MGQAERRAFQVFGGTSPAVTAQHAWTFDEFSQAIQQALSIEEPDKLLLPGFGAYALTQPYRANENVSSISQVACDFDGVPEMIWQAALSALRADPVSCFWYGSPNDGKDGFRKVRLVVETDRPLAPHELNPVRDWLCKHVVKIPHDSQARGASHFYFVGRITGTPRRAFERIHGETLPADDVLKLAPVPAQNATAARADRNESDFETEGHNHDAVIELLTPYYQRGPRHPIAYGLGGYYCNRGYTRADAERVVSRLPSDKIDSRVKTAFDAFDAETPAGWQKLQEANLPAEVMQRLEALIPNRSAHTCADFAAHVNRSRELGVAPWGLAVLEAANDARTEPEASDTYEKIDATIARLADRSVYQRDGQLVRITREAIDDSGVTRAAGAPTVRQLPQVRLGEIIATVLLPGLLADAERDYQAELAAATFPTKREQVEATHEARRQKAFERAASLGNKQAIVILARGEWAHIRPLDAIVTYPTMRPDGSILNVSGYDPQTRTLADLSVSVDLPEQPTIDNARASLQRLENLVRDFPFASAAHRSAWLAMVLTLVARPAINGPTPMGLFDATAAGSGKGLLCDVGALITLGQKATVRVAPKTREEWDKSMLSLLSAADPLVVFDNISGMLGSDALEAVLTSGTFTQRQLGVSEDRKLQVRTVFWATANNARLSTDLVRRSLHCRLEPQCENPEARPESDFTHPQLREHVTANRAQYLADALTIVRAYAVAGRPKVNARPMGSFEAWCRVVRDALVWAGGADPVETQAALRESADVERDEFSALAHAWHDALGDRLVTASELLRLARQSVSAASPLLEALTGLMPRGAEPTAHAVGNRLRMLRGKFVGGLVLREGPKARNVATYQVVTV